MSPKIRKPVGIYFDTDGPNSLPEDTAGQRLKKARLLKNLTIKELVKLSGVSETSIITAEKDRRIPHLDTINKLCAVLGTGNQYILNTADWPENTISETIKKYRSEMGLTQKQLAQKPDVNVSAVSDFEMGRIKGYTENAKKVFKFLGVEPN